MCDFGGKIEATQFSRNHKCSFSDNLHSTRPSTPDADSHLHTLAMTSLTLPILANELLPKSGTHCLGRQQIAIMFEL